ncbi:MAG TPA: S53 family peptidase [Rhizomicrobium sp.]|jgi:subtilase family serine protease|nr:S53 family peptidase [Rhizomicrobium sp.]
MRNPILVSCTLVGLIAAFGTAAGAQSIGPSRPQITHAVDDANRVPLAGNTRPEVQNKANDRGLVPDSMPLAHMQLLMRRPAAQEQALETAIDQLYDAHSQSFHHWLTAAQIGQQYGPAAQDAQTVTAWLAGKGFTVNAIDPTGMVVDFSGTAGQVRTALHTEIHYLNVQGVRHIANMTDPQIPAALAPAVSGIVSLQDFRPHKLSKPRPNYTYNAQGQAWQAVVPADLATIYNLTPLFTAGTTGKGQTIVVIEDTDVYSPSDWSKFRSAFGLAGYTFGSFTTVHPSNQPAHGNCVDPGVNGDDGEAILDAEWASASAPNAAIELASCNDTRTTFGGLIALQNIVAAPNPPPIVSISYGECEAYLGAAGNLAYYTVYQQAAAEGVSVFVAAGDEGAASCDYGEASAFQGIAVSGFASTPYNVAVGGTDFGDAYANTVNKYWSKTNTAAFGSALSYVPEIPWNDSCASTLGAIALTGSSTTYGRSGFCNSWTGSQFLDVVGGSGGPSGCALGASSPSSWAAVSGSCKGYAKPKWQTGVGVPADGVRDIPDVSLFAADGIWGHYYVFCFTDRYNGGAPCTGAPSNWAGAGGTSFAAPILAGIQALVDQKKAAREGNPNPVYYALAATENGAKGNAGCDSTRGKTVKSTCVFYDITLGDMDVPCNGPFDCYLPSGHEGVLSTSSKAYDPAYATGAGWDFATGIGSLNANNLVNAWP